MRTAEVDLQDKQYLPLQRIVKDPAPNIRYRSNKRSKERVPKIVKANEAKSTEPRSMSNLTKKQIDEGKAKMQQEQWKQDFI